MDQNAPPETSGSGIAFGPSAGPDLPQLSEAVADAIVNAVAQGALSPGQRVVETELAAQLNVSRVPVREAIKTLQAQGVLTVTPNRGARVAAFDAPMADQVFEVRLALESIAVRDACRTYRREPRRLDALRAIVSRMERASGWSDWVELRKCDVEFHREMCRASGNEIVLKLWEAIARHITIIFGRELAEERNFGLVVAQHTDLIERLGRSDPEIDLVLKAHILRLRRRTV